MRILLVEDDALLGDGLQAGLTHLGFQLDWVRDGVEALNAVFSHEYAAVVLDLCVPRLDGLALLRRIRGSHLTFPHHRLPVPEAVSLIHPRDGRAMFAIPWEGVTIVGTTDIDHPSLDEEPCIAASEVEYLLEALSLIHI